MKKILVTDDIPGWSFLNNVVIVNAAEYIENSTQDFSYFSQVINLCSCYDPKSLGAAVSILASARNTKVLPTLTHIQEGFHKQLAKSIFAEISPEIQCLLKYCKKKIVRLYVYFGKSQGPYKNIAKKLYNLFPFPLVTFELEKKKSWSLKKLTPLSLATIPEQDILFMKKAAQSFFIKKRLPIPLIKTSAKYTIAMLIKKKEETAPSNPKALAEFVKAGASMGINVKPVTYQEMKPLPTYDGLFIRTTTAINHYTYKLAREAERANIVVIDDPSSIIKCTNKIFLAELMSCHDIPTPATQFIYRYDQSFPMIDFPCVLKRPDGSCSKGVVKIEDMRALKFHTKKLFKYSELLLVQPYIPTEFDWRIGIIDNEPLFACRYYMAKNHWQIVNWNCAIEDDILIFDTVDLTEVPTDVIKLALKATRLIGDGLYGVDIKSTPHQNYLIEVNDNPSINYAIEDKVLKSHLYERILQVFLKRITRKCEY